MGDAMSTDGRIDGNDGNNGNSVSSEVMTASTGSDNAQYGDPPVAGAKLVHVPPSERRGKPVREYYYWRCPDGSRIKAIDTTEITVKSTPASMTLSKKKVNGDSTIEARQEYIDRVLGKNRKQHADETENSDGGDAGNEGKTDVSVDQHLLGLDASDLLGDVGIDGITDPSDAYRSINDELNGLTEEHILSEREGVLRSTRVRNEKVLKTIEDASKYTTADLERNKDIARTLLDRNRDKSWGLDDAIASIRKSRKNGGSQLDRHNRDILALNDARSIHPGLYISPYRINKIIDDDPNVGWSLVHGNHVVDSVSIDDSVNVKFTFKGGKPGTDAGNASIEDHQATDGETWSVTIPANDVSPLVGAIKDKKETDKISSQLDAYVHHQRGNNDPIDDEHYDKRGFRGREADAEGLRRALINVEPVPVGDDVIDPSLPERRHICVNVRKDVEKLMRDSREHADETANQCRSRRLSLNQSKVLLEAMDGMTRVSRSAASSRTMDRTVREFIRRSGPDNVGDARIIGERRFHGKNQFLIDAYVSRDAPIIGDRINTTGYSFAPYGEKFNDSTGSRMRAIVTADGRREYRDTVDKQGDYYPLQWVVPSY